MAQYPNEGKLDNFKWSQEKKMTVDKEEILMSEDNRCKIQKGAHRLTKFWKITKKVNFSMSKELLLNDYYQTAKGCIRF